MSAVARRLAAFSDAPVEELAAALVACRGQAGHHKFASISLAAPHRRPSELAPLWPADHRSLWQRAGDLSFVTSGVEAALSVPDAPDRFSQAARLGAALLAQVHTNADAAGPAPVLMGGFSFATTSPEPSWADFGSGHFHLPRWRYSVHRADAHLTLTTRASASDDEIRVACAELTGLWSAFASSPSTDRASSCGGIVEQDRAAWCTLVTGILDEIGAGRVEKIALARRSQVPLTGGSKPIALLDALSHSHPECRAFAYERGDKCFLGATPENLIRKRGPLVTSQALAGSIDSHQPSAAQKLLDSAKDRGEQDVVVRAIATQLRKFCSDLAVGAKPTIRELRDVLHLHTDISGTLDADTHVLSLVGALHPTPAVGGYPRQPALEWLSTHEPFDRGWYAAPVGWFDRYGDGDFAVAIRSALFVPGQALLYAGAGIVADSDPDSEYDETGLKQQAVLGAL